MRSLETKIGAVLISAVLAAAAGHAQAVSGDSTVAAIQPAVQPVYAGSPGNAIRSSRSSQPQTSDQVVLAGAQPISSEAELETRSYWQPLFNLTSTADSNPLGVGNSVSLAPWTSFYGGVDFHEASHRSDLRVNYLGGAVISQYQNEDAPIQQLMFAERLSGRYATIAFFDQFGFFPEAVSPINLPTALNSLSATNEPLLQPVFLPNQTIASAVGRNLTNTSASELDVSVGRHSSFSVLGSYSIARFFNNNLLDLNDVVLQTGFNHQLTRNNTIGLLYRFIGFRFNNVYQPMNGHVVQAAFARRVTDRWAFEVSAGPELAQFRSVYGQTPLASGSAGTQLQRVYPTADFSATYRTGRSLLRLGYDRGVTDGAGFLTGAITDAGYGSVERQLSRRIIGQLTWGYAENRALIALLTPQQTVNQIYDDWFGGATVTHAWGRWAGVFLSYQIQRQSTNFACAGVVCGNDFTRQLFSIGLTMRAQPRLIG